MRCIFELYLVGKLKRVAKNHQFFKYFYRNFLVLSAKMSSVTRAKLTILIVMSQIHKDQLAFISLFEMCDLELLDKLKTRIRTITDII